MLKKVRVRLKTQREEWQGSFFAEPQTKENEPHRVPHAEREEMGFATVARMLDDGERISISYEEPQDSGMEGVVTTISFHRSAPQVVSLTRDGGAVTSFLFEKGRRHESIYRTAVMPFEVCLVTNEVENKWESEGNLCLCYVLELRGGAPAHVTFSLVLEGGK